MYGAFVAFDRDEVADVAVFWGEGGAFCAGADFRLERHLEHAEPLVLEDHLAVFRRRDDGVERPPDPRSLY
jgi:enoyl-CoA hydratase